MADDSNPVAKSIDEQSVVPRHIAIIMDGNGRWAKKRLLPRTAGHYAGVKAVKRTVQSCVKNNVEVLTLFAFSSENWRRPAEEVSILMRLFVATLDSEVGQLHEQQIRLRIIGDTSMFSPLLQDKIAATEELTKDNRRMDLVIAANYGGRWDMTEALRGIARNVARGELDPDDISEELISSQLTLPDLPSPDLFIRTGGECRISNFLLWHLAYTELYFTPTLWPDFNEGAFEAAISDFSKRQRRFGHTGDQIREMQSQ